MQEKPLGLFATTMIIVCIGTRLHMVVSCAMYGKDFWIYYLLALVCFLLPSLLIVTELVTSVPVSGGAYVWVERAFGRQMGYFAACLQWLNSLLWVPTALSFIGSTIAFMIDPALTEQRVIITSAMLLLFWILTFISCLGLRISSIVSAGCALVGVILPAIILTSFGLLWYMQSSSGGLVLNLENYWDVRLLQRSQLSFLTQIIMSLIGLEMVFVNTGEIENPQKTVPRAIILATSIILLIATATPTALSFVMPQGQVAALAGFFTAVEMFFDHFRLPQETFLLMVMLFLIGKCGKIIIRLTCSNRSLYIASVACKMPAFFQMANRLHAPIGLLILQALIVSIVVSVSMLLDPEGNEYWKLAVLPAQLTFIYYILVFAAAVKIKRSHLNEPGAFLIPGGTWGTILAAAVSMGVCLMALFFYVFSFREETLKHGLYLHPIWAIAALAIVIGGGVFAMRAPSPTTRVNSSVIDKMKL